MNNQQIISILMFTLVAVLIGSGCGDLLSKSCNEAGCQDSLGIEAKLADGSEVKGLSGEVNNQPFDCGDDASETPDRIQCQGDTIVIHEALNTVNLKLSLQKDGEQFRHNSTLEPSYETKYPNGKTCPGKCQQATETVSLTKESE